jgi:phytoene synthase
MHETFDQIADEQQVIAVHSKSFALASKLLPREVRSDVCKLYAWCRWCDNAVDEAPSYAAAKSRLNTLRSDVECIYDNRDVELPASKWLADLVLRYDLPKQLPLDLLLGMESDLDFQPVKNVADLELYCYRVAGVVGLMMCRLLGVKDELAYENANRLGIAMQMTNIARDVAEDWDRGRCYLPQSWLDVDPSADDRPTDELVSESVERLLKLAERNYKIGYRGYSALPSGTRIAIRVAAAVYREIGTEIEKSGFNVMQKRHFVSTPKKFMLAGRQLLEEFSNRIRGRLPKSTNYGSFQTELTTFSKATTMNTDFHFSAIFGLSMTLVMATVLFALMAMNPKMESYSVMPWVYSGGCALGATALWFWAQNISRKIDAMADANANDK